MNRDCLYEYEPYHPYLDLIREMMYGFGDNVQTLPQAVSLMEAIAKDYLQTIINKTFDQLECRGGKLDEEVFLYTIRNDREKFERAKYLLFESQDIRSARNEVPDDDE